LACVFIVSLAFESVGVATGLVDGPYHYSLKLGPLFLGLVPFLIPVAWFMMMYPSFVIADWLVPARGRGWRILAVAAVGGLVMTAWDLVMDPVMVRGGHWIWEVDGAYFGIPLQNFWGWWLTTFVTFLVFLLFNPSSPQTPDGSHDGLAILSYATTGLGNTIGALLVGLGGPALVGFFAMAPWILMGWIHLSSASRDKIPCVQGDNDMS
jgi:putative membrane protein